MGEQRVEFYLVNWYWLSSSFWLKLLVLVIEVVDSLYRYHETYRNVKSMWPSAEPQLIGYIG